jgi:hypothetical protein
METIRNYLDNMFAGLPKTARVLDLKNNILSNMEEKYNELKNQGKSENEAIGIVISEFGNIDELVNELGIRKEEKEVSLPVINEEEAKAYLRAKKTMGIQISIGVFLCITAPVMLLLLNGLFEQNIIKNHFSKSTMGTPGLIALFVMVAAAVAIFIFSGMNFERYQYMEKGVQLPGSMEYSLKQRYDRYTPVFYLHIVIGVCLIVLSPISIFVASLIGEEASYFGVAVLLLIVAISVTLFISAGTVRESYERLLNIGDYTAKSEEEKKEGKIIGAIASIVWPFATAIFLFIGFVYNKWYIAWIIFPITGILFGMFTAVYKIMTDKSE